MWVSVQSFHRGGSANTETRSAASPSSSATQDASGIDKANTEKIIIGPLSRRQDELVQKWILSHTTYEESRARL